jgi:hypothetical protein
MENAMKGIYKFFWDCRRGGRVEGTFIAESEAVSAAIGKDLYFGEILGKHSEVYGILDEGDITLKSTDPNFIAMFEEILGGGVGYNPLDYINEDEDEDNEDC